MNAIIQSGALLRGALTVPPDKAICHRAVLASALAAGETAIAPWPDADDCQHTLGLVERLGVTVRRAKERVTVTGVGAAGLRAPDQELSCGESGTTLRLAAGVLAGQPFSSTLSAGAAAGRGGVGGVCAGVR